jgi:protocatechuate 3,4-dioxygenase beta subunit
MPGAFVEVRNVMSGTFLKVRTDERGHYEATRLRPGQYSLWLETPDHVSVWVPRVFVERGRTTHQDIAPGPPIS